MKNKVVVIIQAHNQVRIAEKMNELNLMKIMGWHNEISDDEIVYTVKELIEDYNTRRVMSCNLRRYISRRGIYNIVEEIDNYIKNI